VSKVLEVLEWGDIVTYPETITFEADGVDHIALVGLPRNHPGGDKMTRVVNGVEYQILISLAGGGFIARPIEAEES
jgi:hypothetical protein